MQMRRILPPSPPGIMQACMRWSFDSLRGKLAGTGSVPCLIVTISAGARLSAVGSGDRGGRHQLYFVDRRTILLVAALQRVPVCAAAGVAAKRTASNHFFDMAYLLCALCSVLCALCFLLLPLPSVSALDLDAPAACEVSPPCAFR